ncbi:hypothetical protein GCM10009721_24310 [Terrabacter tumescens]|uniref:Uncharacterized protein n=1 Tax=Terrabacter tumescens TaxID=60443 RepID=A0ABQ2I256_9MICO|nr:hypothetical protein GCM10009721_24310 [Terrabacter tumescens]
MQSTRKSTTTARHLFAMRRSGVRIPSAPQHEEGPDTLFVRSFFMFWVKARGFGRSPERSGGRRLPSAPPTAERPDTLFVRSFFVFRVKARGFGRSPERSGRSGS